MIPDIIKEALKEADVILFKGLNIPAWLESLIEKLDLPVDDIEWVAVTAKPNMEAEPLFSEGTAFGCFHVASAKWGKYTIIVGTHA